ncbi:MAG: hypothetical protein UX12_C0015G0006 [Candidatus Collierbacteria bacterium GW2011_GWC1_45_47]|uniref:Uncharacterized protein n=6 Tax=Candidatus Collieribacteriota TaxID=1752725 RepID=A0A0G1HHU2_9BACT|nr:MAG: hypothetical protein UW23_C0018G0010 [Candidatus Collierbacteria bacterium GW2011_GWA1_44_12]KKT37704.1 MAG: hypothetical protein UW26_C0026G0006 [Candidatus Collierbacteria bacterium GW2011_GWF1_44_12]KKT46490.1 MAG: hypothetical protein UW35_C0013G0013 [Candidatus Collierbacteria bacterium GW2011_GWF2_44_15]KKT68120.1 MAG: hypothetical protein UW62_C0004G0007 [Candidatus Collierbacteria bacterium GW2011_GWB1_44_35]KKT97693.1 MAG: hypothetical protein UW99_C0030G0004 [Candidatus Collie
MKLSVVQTTEVDGEVIENIKLEVTLDPGESYPVGNAAIVACHDGVLFSHYGEKELLIQVADGRHEPMVTLNGESLKSPMRQQFRFGQIVVLVIPRRGKNEIVRQVISRIP